MQDKLKDLFIKINLEKDYQDYLKDAKLKKVMVNTSDDSWCFIIKNTELLPVEIYDRFLILLNNTFDNIKKSYLFIEAENIDYSFVNDYFKYTIQKLKKKSKMLSLFEDREVVLEDSKLIIETHNKVEFNKLDKYKKEIETMFHYIGFKDIDVEIIINKEKSENVKKEIKNEITKDLTKDLGKIKEVDNSLIYGRNIKGKITNIKDLVTEGNNVIVEGYVFAVDFFESSKSNTKIITLKVTDYTDSIYVKIFPKGEEFNRLSAILSDGKWLRIAGYTKNDAYAKDIVLMASDINYIRKEKIKDESKEKRVELHAHTFMSQMDGLIDVKDLIKRAKDWGHKAIAITDHHGVQSFPVAYNSAKDIKILYGAELVMINDEIDIVVRETDEDLISNTYVVFDFETTGFNAGGGDSIIEIGAVKICNGEIIDRFSKLINPGRELPKKITEITGITNKDLKGKDSEEVVLKSFIEWAGDSPMVAHNAKFDASFLEMGYKKYSLGEYKNTLIDTLQLSRTLDSGAGRHGLSYITKRYGVTFNEGFHHRGEYDAEATALVFHKMMKKLIDNNVTKISDLKNLINREDLHKIGNGYHIVLLVQNNKGLRNLFKLVSYANTKYFYKNARILKSEIEKRREGLLIGSACANGEIFNEARSKSDEELINIMSFYDYIEVQPLEVYNHLIQSGDFENEDELKANIEKIIRVAETADKPVCATGDVHHLDRKDKVYREVIINQKVPGGGRHPLNRKGITEIPSCHFRTTEEMLTDFNFLEEEKAFEIVVTNPNKVANMIEEIQVIKDKLYTPIIENSDKLTKEMVWKKAHEKYGEKLPFLIEERLEKELSGVINNGYSVLYLIAQKLVKKSNDDGYFVGSRGSVGSSLVATMMGITEVNPLPPHYLCPKCKKSIFEKDGKTFSSDYKSSYDLPDYVCEECKIPMQKEGQDIPFSSFLGWDAEKVPDIDLNFSSIDQANAHDYTKVLFGEKNVFRAGTIGTVATKTAYGFVKGYCEEKNVIMRNAEIERLAQGVTGAKRTTGQHPGGIIVIPSYMDVFDFTPYQYPADDSKSSWYTTHFDFHAIHDNVLKLDILGHDDPTMLKVLGDLSGIEINSIPFDDSKVLSIFNSPDVLGVTPEQIDTVTGTLGIPEFGTKFAIKMLEEIKPKTFEEIVKVCGLAHGTGIWAGNGKELLVNKKAKFNEIVGYREELIFMLVKYGMDKVMAFKITEYIRKSYRSQNAKMQDARWIPLHNELLQFKDVLPDWFIDHCETIEYLFPKAHAVAYVMMAYRVAWFKVYHPIYYYAAFFGVRCYDFDIETMIKGYDAIKQRIFEIQNKGYDATNKEQAILTVLEVALEATARGFKFGNIDLYKSDNMHFVIDEDNETLIPPFRTIDGLGDTVANKIVSERAKSNFVSIEDLQKRAKLSTTLIDKMRIMGILNGMPESSQLSLF
ncbi:MAG: PolC-type DNA polymerase III [Bacilli bacterium]